MEKYNRGASGQVLIVGVVMLVALLVALLFLFDVHNVIRAKMKVETAHQSAAVAGAEWQKESLNLIGEINLIKACATLLEGDAEWREALPVYPPPERREAALRQRIALLTEMQTRVSFLGPLVGFAAAQQAAKANGLPSHGKLEEYIDLLRNDWRYREGLGGAPDVINNYRWRESYTGTLEAIVSGGVAVFPNSRMGNNPVVFPPELASESFYERIMLHADEIAESDPPDLSQSSWQDELYRFVKNTSGYPFRDADYREKWWDIDYSLTDFPGESEIFTLGLRTGPAGYGGVVGYDDGEFALRREFGELTADEPDLEIYRDAASLPADMKWFCYDFSWYPEYYRGKYDNYDSEHFDYWFGGVTLRRKVRDKYIYEGPAAYVEGYVSLGLTGRVTGSRNFRGDPVRLRSARSVRIGSRRDTGGDAGSSTTDYRPGAIAKPLGELSDERAPIELPLVLPVFDRTSLLPTYMPIPYGFGVMRPGWSALSLFLNWLAGEESLFEPEHSPPASCDLFYRALTEYLSDGPGFRYYGWNPGFNESSFDSRWRDSLEKWENNWQKEVYSSGNRSGAGWLQQPKRCYDALAGGEAGGGRVRMEDFINGGEAERVYLNEYSYYVVDANGHVISNDELDPTVKYMTGGGSGSGNGYGGRTDGPDLQPGPPRF